MKSLRRLTGAIKRNRTLSPIVTAYAATIGRLRTMPPSPDFWEKRYAEGGNSGAGSYGRLAAFKAEVINGIVREYGINSAIEFGCGDGNQLSMAEYSMYTGVDVSRVAVELCRTRFSGDSSKRFLLLEEYRNETADLAMSLDVIYHLVEDEVFDRYMSVLFDAARKHVIIYSSNHTHPTETFSYVRHRQFSDWVTARRGDWHLTRHIPNRFPLKNGTDEESFADFYIYEKRAD